LILDQGKLLDRLDAVHEKERRYLAQGEKSDKAELTEPILVRYAAKFDRLRADQAQERQQERDSQFASSRNITFEHARQSLRVDPYVHDTYRGPFKRDQDMPTPTRSVEEIKQQMEEWRKRNPGRDFGREM
jgi:hypothetical protein